VHVLSAALLARGPAEPFACDVNRPVYPPLLAGGGVAGWVARGYWNDLGTPARYLAACLDVLAGRAGAPPAGADPRAGMVERAPGAWVSPSAEVEEGARLEGPAWVGAGARLVAGSRVGPGAVVGAGSLVAAGGEVRRAVTWDGTVVAPGERLEDAVAAGALRVPAGPAPLTPPAPAPAPR
jgi:mannose-1-phosphate guanylyltransferase